MTLDLWEKVTLIGSRVESDILPVPPINQSADFGRHVLFVIHALPSRFFQSILNFLQYALRPSKIVIFGHYCAINSSGGPFCHVSFGPASDIRVERLVPRVLRLLIIIQQVFLVPTGREGRRAVR